MTAYIVRRLWQMIPTLLGVILLVFFLFKAFGGDPAEILAGLNASQQTVDEDGTPQQQPQENKAKKLLKGLLGR